MSIHSWRELPRSGTHKFGESPKFERRFVLTLSDPSTVTAPMAVTQVGTLHGTAHPEFQWAKCTNLIYNENYEGSRYHAELIAQYEIPYGEDPQATPLSRADTFIFESSGVAVPALFYFDDTANGEIKPLVNSAGDYFEGLTVDEAQQKLTIQANRSAFPSDIARALTNCVNADPWLGADPHHWKCQGIRGERKVEIVDSAEVRYWEITVTLLFRQTGWNLQLPDVGFNYLEDDVKKRAYVIDPEDGTTKIPSANPVALDGDGQLKPPGQPPAILDRRIYREVDFSTYFSQIPT